MNKVVFVCIGLLISFSPPVFSQETVPFEKSWYLGFGAGISKIVPEVGNSGYTVGDDSDTGFKLFAGYDYNKSLGFEVFYSDYGVAILDNQGDTSLRNDAFIDYTIYGVNASWYFWHSVDNHLYHKRQGWQASLVGGLSSLQNGSNLKNNDASSIQGHAGINLEYGFDNGFAIRGSLDVIDVDAVMLSINILKRFGFGLSETTKTSNNYSIDELKQSVSVPLVEHDSDNDGVLDKNDNCENTPQDKVIDASGCAISIDNVPFESAEFNLSQQQKQTLSKVAKKIDEASNVKVNIVGHTDSRGSTEYNQRLSEFRAAHVRDYLISQNISGSIIHTQGFGEFAPIGSNETAQGRAQNRRVELKLLKK